MRTPRIYHSKPLKGVEVLSLDPQAAKHLMTVLRFKAGAPLILFDGSGFEFEAVIEEVGKKEVRVRLGSAHGPAVESPLRISLAQGISRGERMDYTVQKATELGVTEIVPVLTERSVVKLDKDNSPKKQQHWQGVAIGSCEQSGRVRVPEVKTPVTLASFLANLSDAGQKLLLDPLGGAAAMELARPEDGRVMLLVGPEGGLSEHEGNLATRVGFTGLKLGPRILRTETAALVALSLLQSQWGDLG